MSGSNWFHAWMDFRCRAVDPASFPSTKFTEEEKEKKKVAKALKFSSTKFSSIMPLEYTSNRIKPVSQL